MRTGGINLKKKSEKTVYLPYSPIIESPVSMEQFRDWLIVRKQQWRISRRKRQRRQLSFPYLTIEFGTGLVASYDALPSEE
jgi:hypothetical protein